MPLLLKMLHIIMLSVWVAGALYLPRLFALSAKASQAEEYQRINTLEHRTYFEIMTPAAVLTVVFGSALIPYGYEGAWLPAKLTFVVFLVMFHLYCGRMVLQHAKGKPMHGPLFFNLLTLVPIPLAMVIVALAVAKPF